MITSVSQLAERQMLLAAHRPPVRPARMRYTVTAHPPTWLPEQEHTEAAATLTEAETRAATLSADPAHMKAYVYEGGALVAEYGMGHRYDRPAAGGAV